MENTKKRKIIIPLFILLSFIIVGVTLAIILVNIPRTKIEDYEPPFTEYKVYVDGNKYTYYEEINGYLATNKIVVTPKNGKIAKTKKKINKYNEVIELNLEILNNVSTIFKEEWFDKMNYYDDYNYGIEKQQPFYVAINEKMVPIMGIIYHIYNNQYDTRSYLYINLNNGQINGRFDIDTIIRDELISEGFYPPAAKK